MLAVFRVLMRALELLLLLPFRILRVFLDRLRAMPDERRTGDKNGR